MPHFSIQYLNFNVCLADIRAVVVRQRLDPILEKLLSVVRLVQFIIYVRELVAEFAIFYVGLFEFFLELFLRN